MLIKTQKNLKPKIAERAVKAGKLFAEKGYSILETAFELGVSFSTVYKDLGVNLYAADPELYKKVRTVIDKSSKKRYEESGWRLSKEDMKDLKKRAFIAATCFLNEKDLTYEEIGKALGVSAASIRRDLNARLATFYGELYAKVQKELKERREEKEKSKNAKR